MNIPLRRHLVRPLRHLLKLLLHQPSKVKPCESCRRQFSICTKNLNSLDNPDKWQTKYKSSIPEFDWNYLCDPNNVSSIEENIRNRKGIGDLQKVMSLWKQFNQETEASKKESLKNELNIAAGDIPNTHHPLSPLGEENNARLTNTVGKAREFDFEPKTVVDIGESLGVLRADNVTIATGTRSYYFIHELAELEHALIQFTLDLLKQQGYSLVSVPDLIYSPVIECCGFKTTGDRNQVYKLDSSYSDVCLAGTAEMSLAGFLANENLAQQDLPKKLTAVSRCYRREASDIQEEKGIYRVHQFTKIEMFGVTEDETGEESEQLLQHFLQIEQNLFSQIGLHFRILEMPTQCLGAPAYRKYDMEAWMPAKQFWGEISSASNCTDFQSRRLAIKYIDTFGNTKHAHTVNGTACAVPRMIMAIVENFQTKDGCIDIPDVLQPYMNNTTKITPRGNNVQWIKANKLTSIKH